MTIRTTGFKKDHDGVVYVTKDPEAVLPYHIDLALWLATVDGEVLTAAAFTIVDAGITKDSESFTDTRATVQLSSGTAGQDYMVRLDFETATREDQRSFRVKVRNR